MGASGTGIGDRSPSVQSVATVDVGESAANDTFSCGDDGWGDNVDVDDVISVHRVLAVHADPN